MKILGWLGSILLSLCSIPEVIHSIKTGNCTLTWGFLLMWGLGEAFLLVPIIKKIKEPFLIFNYSLNLIFIIILIGYKL